MEAPPVQYATTVDNVRIAYSTAGVGPPLIVMPNPFSHTRLRWGLYDWLLKPLAKAFTIIQYDNRGQGMSQRGLPAQPGTEGFLNDLEAVIGATKLSRFSLFGRGSSGDVAVRYSVQHPERLEALILLDCNVRSDENYTANLQDAASNDWELFLQVTARAFASELPASDALGYLRASATQEDWLRRREAFRHHDLGDTLPQLTTDTLVLGNLDSPLDPGECERVAALIPNSRLLVLEDLRRQLPEAILQFLESCGVTATREAAISSSPLSMRELEVLRLLAAGRSNQQVAEELVISLNTVRRHVSNIFAKIGAANRADAVSYAHTHGLISSQ